ncbi:RDD family protein [Myroides injenensis]|uniref:RDD family protein n=1 Tax=Myroides injenensis TaxID=1183151 RepID=UPI0009DAE988
MNFPEFHAFISIIKDHQSKTSRNYNTPTSKSEYIIRKDNEESKIIPSHNYNFTRHKITYLNNGTLEFLDETTNEIITYRYANFGERFLAFILDFLILLIPSIIFAGIIANWLYFALTQSGKKQQSVGQSALSIQLLSIDGDKVTFGQATGRYFARFLSALIFMIGYLMFFFTDRKQCLHDMIANTLVVREISRRSIF